MLTIQTKKISRERIPLCLMENYVSLQPQVLLQSVLYEDAVTTLQKYKISVFLQAKYPQR
jgi:hypothetical protein